MPSISILMPIYNGIEFIDDSVQSILRQSYTQWELIIGVNGHIENSETYQIAKTYAEEDNRIFAHDLHTIHGKANALNEMLKYCNTDYVAILDVDDIWAENKLKMQVPYLNEYDVVGSRCVYFGDRNDIPYIPVGDISEFDFRQVNPVINSSSIIRKELCYWNDNDGVEDYDLWLRLRKENKKFYNCSNLLVMHRIHNSSAFNSKGQASQKKVLLEAFS
jgi:teichuronic acid biosynthesis glycosyltransferase TuaG